MSHSLYSHPLFPEERRNEPWVIVIAVLLLALLVLVALVVTPGSSPAPMAGAELAPVPALGVNPELRIMQRWQLAAEEAAQQSLLHESPELAVIEQYLSDDSLSYVFLADNPEIAVVRRYREGEH